VMEDSNYDNYTRQQAGAEAGCGVLLMSFIVILIAMAVYIVVRVATVGHVF